MAEAKDRIERPLSPHLTIYKPMINMVMSIVHRITGAALYFARGPQSRVRVSPSR